MRALAALVGAEHRGLELLVRAGLDVVERQALLPADRPQALADVRADRAIVLPSRSAADARPAAGIELRLRRD